MIDDNILDQVLDKIKEIVGFEKFDDNKKWIETDEDIRPDYITLKNVALITCIIQDGDKSYPQLVLQEALYDE